MRYVISLVLLCAFVSAEADLRRNWRDVYSPAEGWQVACQYKLPEGQDMSTCRGPVLAHFQAAAGQASADDVIVQFIYSHRRLVLSVAPYEGECEAGRLAIDGEELVTLVGTRGVCEPDGGQIVATSAGQRRAFATADVLENGTEMTISITLASGATLTRAIPLAGFTAAFDEIK